MNVLFRSISAHAEGLAIRDIIQLSIKTTESWQLPAAWLISTSVQHEWSEQMSGKIGQVQG